VTPRKIAVDRPGAPATGLENGGLRPSGRCATENQRRRMLDAAVEAVGEVGYARMTVDQVIRRARVSRKTFYDAFADREECFLAAFEHELTGARRLAREEYERQSHWREGIRGALGQLLRLMDERPAAASLCIVESLLAGEKVLARRAEVLGEIAEVVDLGRTATSNAREPPRVAAQGVVGGVFAVLHTHLVEHREEPVIELLGPLMSIIVTPYLGGRAAHREVSRPAPEVDGSSLAGLRNGDPVATMAMRVTYRTVRVLTVIAEHPGASNREIAEGSGIVDPGQMSKLLHRLAQRGLVECSRVGEPKTAAKAWHLTAGGALLERHLRPRDAGDLTMVAADDPQPGLAGERDGQAGVVPDGYARREGALRLAG